MSQPLREQAETETRAALAGLAEALEGPPLEAPLALVPLRVYGDALRLGLETPRAIRRWAERCSAQLLDEVLRAAAATLAVPLPPPTTTGASSDPGVASVVVARDHMESLLQGVRRAWLPRPLTQLSAHALLVARLGALDASLSPLLSRGDVQRLLGIRLGLGARWADEFRDDEAGAPVTSAELASFASVPPSPTVVAGYVERGLLPRMVESVAAADPRFADELALAIDAARKSDGQVGFAARRWQRAHAKEDAARDVWTFSAPALAYAAASEPENSLPRDVHRLGRLFEKLDVVATVFVSEREITLTLDCEPGAVTAVTFGTETRQLGASDESCAITIPRSASPILLRVIARSGEALAEELSFVASAT